MTSRGKKNTISSAFNLSRDLKLQLCLGRIALVSGLDKTPKAMIIILMHMSMFVYTV